MAIDPVGTDSGLAAGEYDADAVAAPAADDAKPVDVSSSEAPKAAARPLGLGAAA